MGKNNHIYDSRRQAREARLGIVAELYSKGKSYSKIRSEVMARLNLETYSKATVLKDVKSLLKEWREARLEDTDEAVTLFLERNRQHYEETREEWERSRETGSSVKEKERTGRPIGYKATGDPEKDKDPENKIKTSEVREKDRTFSAEGDPRYMELLIKLEDQRAKVLGLYAPEEKRITGKDGEPLLSGIADLDISKLDDNEKAMLLELARKCGD